MAKIIHCLTRDVDERTANTCSRTFAFAERTNRGLISERTNELNNLFVRVFVVFVHTAVTGI